MFDMRSLRSESSWDGSHDLDDRVNVHEDCIAEPAKVLLLRGCIQT